MFPPKILPYTVQAYQDSYEDEFITSFTHEGLAVGVIDPEKAKGIVNRLNTGSCHVIPAITFNPKMVKGQLTGGACSAISFRVAKEALFLLKSIQENKELSRSSKEHCFASHLTRFIQIQEGMDKKEQLDVRTVQMALNTITVDRETIKSGNAVREKVSAMAPFYGLRVVSSCPEPSYPELSVRGNEQLENQLSEQMRDLQEGVYFLRIIIKEYNHKLEEKGHSIVYIKTGDSQYYFDPQLGFYHLYPEVTKTNLVYNALLSANEKFGVDVLSFHRLEDSVSSEPISVDDLGLKGILYSPCQKLENCPVVILSPGLGVSINAYKKMAMGLASRGFMVMCLDHPGTGIGIPRLEDDEIIARGLQNGCNVAKVSELIRQGYFANVRRETPIGVLGHSLGGSASVEACRRSSLIQAAINMDGRIIHPTDVSQPVLQFVAKDVKEDRTKYNEALAILAKENPLLQQRELDVKHNVFSSPQPGFLNDLIEESVNFFSKYLGKGEQK